MRLFLLLVSIYFTLFEILLRDTRAQDLSKSFVCRLTLKVPPGNDGGRQQLILYSRILPGRRRQASREHNPSSLPQIVSSSRIVDEVAETSALTTEIDPQYDLRACSKLMMSRHSDQR